jgi:hypothetical protein
MAANNRATLIAAAEALIGYVFIDSEEIWEAVQASGSNMAYKYPEGNKRLAMIGDVVLKLALLDILRALNMPRGKDKYSQLYISADNIYAKTNFRFHGQSCPENCEQHKPREGRETNPYRGPREQEPVPARRCSSTHRIRYG